MRLRPTAATFTDFLHTSSSCSISGRRMHDRSIHTYSYFASVVSCFVGSTSKYIRSISYIRTYSSVAGLSRSTVEGRSSYGCWPRKQYTGTLTLTLSSLYPPTSYNYHNQLMDCCCMMQQYHHLGLAWLSALSLSKIQTCPRFWISD